MNRQQLPCAFDWQRWSSAEEDLAAADRTLAARIVFQTLLIRAFESELLRLKNEDCVWGPVHSSVGQEAGAAAAMAALRKSDRIAASHRAHHHFLAKALNYALPDRWDPRRRELPPEGLEVVRRTMAEILGLAPGWCGGRGGSMHLRWAEAGILGTNAIVGGGIPLATGAAYAELRRAGGGIVACFFGDGAANQGSFHEALNLAGLWKLPIVYFIENNRYAVGTRTEEAAAVRDLSQRAAAYGMKGRLVEGCDPLAVHAVMREAAESCRAGGGPVLIECLCYRHFHHAGDRPGSAFGYRSREEEEGELRRDALQTFPAALQAAGLLSAGELERLRRGAEEAVRQAVDFCVEIQPGAPGPGRRRPRPQLWPAAATAAGGARSDGRELEGLRYSEIEDFPEREEMRYSDAIAAVTGRWLERDPAAVVLGEEVANFGGGAYGATRGLAQRFPGRVVNTPISEAGFVGLSLGAAMSGLPVIVEIMFPDFALVAADQLFNQIAKARHMYGGTTDLPLVVRTRIATGCGYGGQHSMDPSGLFALFSGWRIVAPSNAFDYIGLFNTAMRSLDPVVILEHHSLYGQKFPVPKGELDYFLPFGRARRLSEGSDITVLACGGMTARLQALLPQLRARGVSAELIDLRTLDLPGIDYGTIGASVEKTGAVAVVEQAAAGQGIGARIAAQIAERFFDALDAPPGVLCSLDVPPPVSRALEAAALIGDGEILETVEAMAARRWR